MRRLLLLVAALVFVDTMLFAALTPLLPHFAHTLGLSKVRAGVLVGAYAAGALLGGLPGGAAAARLGPRRAVLVGLAGMGLASLGFALAESFWSLFAARLVRGVGSAFTWAGAVAWAIGATWLTGAALETVGSPLVGRLVDRRGRLLPVRIALVLGLLVSLGLAAGPRPLAYAPLIVLAAAAYGILFTPAFALIADGAELAALPQGMAFGFMSAAWALGAFVGPAAAGAIAGATGDWIPFLLAAGLCAAAL